MLEVIPAVARGTVQVAEHLNLVSLGRAAKAGLGLADEAAALGKAGLESGAVRTALGRVVEAGVTEVPEVVMKPGLLQLANMAGARAKFGDEALEVFAHGTIASEVNTFVKMQGRNLSEIGGNFGGKFFTAVDLDVAGEFALRTASKLRGEPRILGIVMPRSVADSLQRNRWLTTKRIDDRMGLESTFLPSSFRSLQSKGFFFDLTKVLQEGVKL